MFNSNFLSKMTQNNFNLRKVAMIAFLAGVTMLSSCGGGSGNKAAAQSTGLSGIWESSNWRCCDKYEGEYGGWVGPSIIEFSGKSFTRTYSSGYPPDDRYVPERTIKGKYSISGDKIEFVLDNGSIRIYTFSHIDNTITIDSKKFTKKQ